VNTGKTLFAQLMDFLPWTTFARIVGRYDGDRAIRTLSWNSSPWAQRVTTGRIICHRAVPLGTAAILAGPRVAT
jgi:Domain of unknown function (DUF4372)